ncbi:hypothetical protein HII31_10252 [Pseudocercospora fuligena]|uniref:Uncharacterized protein n=1 Tax=Pseudocercospora fuligena TaxID=685502 RepID=A0A8H6VEN8_9PEZI|nr:hypothetical protein HII31_10252 [Pseudocercospora fuligena]
MANKENLPPRGTGSPQLGDDTPPGNLSTAIGIRHWQHAAYASPPFGLLSPNSKPSLARQRDHSACRRAAAADSPLKVRKTRENLRQTSIVADVPPPCLHSASPCKAPEYRQAPTLSFTSATTMNDSVGDLVGLGEQNDMTGTTLVSAASFYESHPARPVSPPLQIPGKMSRHKSVSRRMLTRVKEGITSRSRSSHSGRNADDAGLMRRWSGRRKQSGEEQSRMQSFEVSRESIDSQDLDPDVVTQRSFTDSSISNDELMISLTNLTPPPSLGVESRRPSSALLPPSPSPEPRSPAGEPTPRAIYRDCTFETEKKTGLLPAAVPFIDLNIEVDRDSVDVGVAREVWVSVEATVRTKIVSTHSARKGEDLPLREKTIDAVVVVCQEALDALANLTKQCLIELSSRLNVPGDRLLVLAAKSTRLNATTISCECAELHPLQAPKTAALLDKLGFTPSSARDSLLHTVSEWQPLHLSLREVAKQDLRECSTHAFVVSSNPAHIVQAVANSTQWPTHAVKLGFGPAPSYLGSDSSRYCWELEFKGQGDANSEVLNNLFRDVRHDCNAGAIPSLRLCYKAMNDSRITEIVGEKAMKDLSLGKCCSLFLRVRVPKIETEKGQDQADQDSLFAELKSIVGTLESNFLHIEARYRHSALPLNNIATVRQICSIKRPKTESRWSLSAASVDKIPLESVHGKLARFLAAHYPPSKASKLIDHWNLANTKRVLQVRRHLELKSQDDRNAIECEASPKVIVTDADFDQNTRSVSTPAAVEDKGIGSSSNAFKSGSKLQRSVSTNTVVPARTISSPKITTATTLSATSSSPLSRDTREATPTDAADTARQLWHHIRRNSLSASQMLEMSPDQLQQLEATDPALKELRDKALANKRSVGAETLKAWKWDGKMRAKVDGEAPWL